jgi:pimeloyl-ACP methyl ester carboxylesterase
MTETCGFLTHRGAGLAWRRVEGQGPVVVWLGGYRSDMTGTKAQALADWARETGHAFLRFDYFAHGASEGAFEDATVTRWRGDALAVIDALADGPVVLVGSSMGGWLACLAAMVRPARIKALVLIAPAADFTEKLIDPGLITPALREDGARWSILLSPVPVTAPVRILQGGADPDVPWTHALELANALKGEDVVFTLIRDGDHRLSRPQDLRRLIVAVEEVADG